MTNLYKNILENDRRQLRHFFVALSLAEGDVSGNEAINFNAS